jgi:replicative DNA helicase
MHVEYLKALLNPVAYTKAKASGLRQNWFDSQFESLFIELLEKYHSMDAITDTRSVFDWLSMLHIPNDEMRAKFALFVDNVMSSAEAKDPHVVTEILKSKYLSKILTVDLDKVIRKISSNDYYGAVSELQQLTSDASALTADRREADIRDGWVHTEARKVVHGLSMGYKTIDKATGGLRPGELLTILSGPSEGKTTFMVNLAYNIFKNGGNVLFFSIEMPLINMVKRLQSHITKIPNTKIKTNTLSADEEVILDKSIKQLTNSSNYFKIIDAPGATLAFIESVLREQVVMPDVVVVDYLGIIQHSQFSKSNWEALNATTIALRAIGRKYKVPIITASQVNREGVKTKREFYEKGDIALNFALTFHADIILSLRLSDPDMLTIAPVCLLNAKFIKDRDGELPAFTLKADFSTYTVEELIDSFSATNQSVQENKPDEQPGSVEPAQSSDQI